jgi:hypothetical protein
MLKFAQKFALFVYPLRYLLIVLGALLLGGFAYVIFLSNPEQDKYLLPISVCFAWVVCLLGVSSYFRLVPEIPAEKLGIFARFKLKLSRAVAWFWAWCFCFFSVILVYLSIRSLTLVLSS